ncbi:unnamed protein product [Alopecurus aequalis]
MQLAQIQMTPCLQVLSHCSQPMISKSTYLKFLLLSGNAHHIYYWTQTGMLPLEKKIRRLLYKMRECLELLRLCIHVRRTFRQSKQSSYWFTDSSDLTLPSLFIDFFCQSSPFVSLDVKDSGYDDSQTLSVPLNPIEDDDASDQSEAPLLDMPNNHYQSEKYDPARVNVPQVSNTLISAAQPYGSNGATSNGLSAEPDVLAAASAAFTAIMQSNQKGSMVDKDLLVKILSDPAQVERLMQEYSQIKHQQSRSSSVVAPMPPGPPPHVTVSAPMSAPASFSDHITTFQNTNSTHPLPPRMAPPPPIAPAPMMNRPPQGFPPVAMNRPLGSSPAMNLPPGSSLAMNLPPRSSPAMNSMNFSPGSSPSMNSMNLPPGSSPSMNSMNLPPGSSQSMNSMNLPPGSSPSMNAINRPPGSSPAMNAMNLPPGTSPAMNFSSAPLRGIPYYKTLIHQHGGERQEPPEQQGMQYGMYQQSAPPQTDATNGASMVSRDTKFRPMKLCAYFNGPRGCRNGANCTFLHDTSAPSRQDDSKGSKRIKLDSRIAGRN